MSAVLIIHLKSNFYNSLAFAGAVLGTKWRHFRTTEQMELMLSRAGFVNIHVVGDNNYLLPTIIGYKN